MKFIRGSMPDKEYEKAYKGNLSTGVKDKCRKFSNAYFKCNKGFGQREADISRIKPKIHAIQDKLFEVDGNNFKLLDYFEFLILHKGNYEFMIPYYKICNEIGYIPHKEISLCHDTHTFGLMGTVDEILSE